MRDWKADVLVEADVRANRPDAVADAPGCDRDGIVTIPFSENLGTRFHAKMPKGAALRELQGVHLHLAYWETPYYEAAIRELMLCDLDPGQSVVADVGCGDGRFTAFLLKQGFQRVIAIDADRKPLEALARYAREQKAEDRLLLIHASATRIPLRAESLDAILAIGVFYYLNDDYETAFAEAVGKLRPGGILVNSEPDLEGAIYKSACFEEVADIIENFASRRFKEEKGDTQFKFRLFAAGDMPGFLGAQGMECRDSRAIPLLPSIIRIKMVRGELDPADIAAHEPQLRAVMDYLAVHGGVAKHRLWKSVKPHADVPGMSHRASADRLHGEGKRPLILLRDTSFGQPELAAFIRSVDHDFIPPLSSRVDVNAYASKLRNQAVTFLAREHADGPILGAVSFYCDPSRYDVAHLSFLAVAPAARGRGCARALLNRCTDYARAAGMSSVKTRTWLGNRPMVRLLENLGYESQGERDDGDGRRSIHFRLELAHRP